MGSEVPQEGKSILIKGDSEDILLREEKKGLYVVELPKDLD